MTTENKTPEQIKAENDAAAVKQAEATKAQEAEAAKKRDAEAAKQREAAAAKDKDVATSKEQTAKSDAAMTESRKDPVIVTNPNAPEAVRAQHEAVDAALAKRNEENAEGHSVNMEKAEAEAHESAARMKHADDHRAGHVPTGKENNRNTPRVLKDGTKVWDT